MAEIEINSRCNRKCSYCPVSVLPVPNVPKLMPDAVFTRIINEFVRIGYRGRLAYHLYSEPLLHPRIVPIIRKVSEELPDVRQILYTNGDFLSNQLYDELMDAGLARIILTSHDGTLVQERENQVVLFPSELNITNRGGVMSEFGEMPLVNSPLSFPCYAPSSMLIITATGDVLLCYEDAKRSNIFGNIMKNDIEKIWFSTDFIRTRDMLANGERTITRICTHCSNKSHPTPETFDFRL